MKFHFVMACSDAVVTLIIIFSSSSVKAGESRYLRLSNLNMMQPAGVYAMGYEMTPYLD